MLKYNSEENNQIIRSFIELKQITSELKPGKLLDIGCGEGDTMKFFSLFGWECVGIEISGKNSMQAKKYGSAIVGSAETLPFKNAYFDLIIVEQVLHHTDDPLKVLLEAKRCLKNDQLLLLSETINDNLIIRLGRCIYPRYKNIDVKSKFYERDIIIWLKKTNFVITHYGREENIPYLGAIGEKLVSIVKKVMKNTKIFVGCYFCLARKK